MRFNRSLKGNEALGENAANLSPMLGVMVLWLLASFLLFASQSLFAQSFDITCSNLNNNPSTSDCLIDYNNGSPPVPISDSQVSNLVNDFDDIKICSDGIAAGATGSCTSTRYTCDITKDGAGNVTSASCGLGTVPKTVFEVSCTTINAADAQCTITNDVGAIRANLSPTGPIGSVLTPTQLSFANTMLTVCDNQFGITNALQSDCLLLETLISNESPQAAVLIDAITPDAASVAVDATQTSLRGINRNIAQRMSSIRRAARMGRMASRQQGGATGPNGGDAGSGNSNNDEENKDKDEKKDDSDEDQQGFLRSAPSNWLAANENQWRARYHALNGGGASADLSNGQLGVFVNAMTDKGDRETTGKERGFDLSGAELTAGVDYRVGSSGFFGMAFGFTHSNTDIKDGRGKLSNRAYNLVFYGSVNPTMESFIDMNLIIGGGQFEQDRNVVFTDPVTPANNIDQVYSANYFSRQSSLSLSMGYDLAAGSFSISPYVGLNVMNSKADGYDESVSNPGAPGGGMSLQINEQSFASKTMTFGAQMAYANNRSWGVLMPQATLEWINETKGNAEVVKGHFIGDPNKQEFRLPTDDVDSVYYSLGLGLSAIYPGGNTVYGFYQQFIGYQGFSYGSFNVGMRWEL